MIKSMTGFGRCEISEGDRKFTVEMKGVNHRYLDMSIRMPKKLNFFETAIRTEIKKRIQRGKVDIFISYEDLSDGQVSLKYNESLAAEYLEYFKQMVQHCDGCIEQLTWNFGENYQSVKDYQRDKTFYESVVARLEA